MRIKVSGDIGFIVVSIAAIGIFYGAMSWLLENIFLRNLSKEEQAKHILSKILLYVTLFLFIADIFLVILPVFGVQLLPFTLLDFL